MNKEKTSNLIPFVTWINSELDKKPTIMNAVKSIPIFFTD